jgi:hypothetical protein
VAGPWGICAWTRTVVTTPACLCCTCSLCSLATPPAQGLLPAMLGEYGWTPAPLPVAECVGSAGAGTTAVEPQALVRQVCAACQHQTPVDARSQPVAARLSTCCLWCAVDGHVQWEDGGLCWQPCAPQSSTAAVWTMAWMLTQRSPPGLLHVQLPAPQHCTGHCGQTSSHAGWWRFHCSPAAGASVAASVQAALKAPHARGLLGRRVRALPPFVGRVVGDTAGIGGWGGRGGVQLAWGYHKALP